MHSKKLAPILYVCLAATLLACARTPTATPAPTPRVVPTITGAPTRASVPPPAWWDASLALPPHVEFIGDAERAVWRTRETNAQEMRDFVLRQAARAGYRTFVVTQSPDAIYDVLLVKGARAYALNITVGSDLTMLTGARVGVLHVKVSGETNIELDLPLRHRLDVSPGSEVSLGTSVPSPQCASCEYLVNVHIAPFKGAGDYDSKPGTYLIDVQVIPGGDPEQDDYRWAIGGCVVSVEETRGSFDCKQLQNVVDQSKRIDVSGNWTQP